MSRWKVLSAAAAAALLVTTAAAQGGAPPTDGHETPPVDPLPCAYTIRPIGPFPRQDWKDVGDDFAHASALGAVFVGEADVDSAALAVAAASSIGWRLQHHAVKTGPTPCGPVSFSDELHLSARVETRLTGWSGARYAQCAGAAFMSSSVVPPTSIAVLAANNDTGQNVTVTLLLPLPSAGGFGIVPVPFSIANPTANTVCVDEKRGLALGQRQTESNLVVGYSSLQIGAGSSGLLSGSGRARVVWSDVDFRSASTCTTHGVTMAFPGYAALWRSSFSGF